MDVKIYKGRIVLPRALPTEPDAQAWVEGGVVIASDHLAALTAERNRARGMVEALEILCNAVEGIHDSTTYAQMRAGKEVWKKAMTQLHIPWGHAKSALAAYKSTQPAATPADKEKCKDCGGRGEIAYCPICGDVEHCRTYGHRYKHLPCHCSLPNPTQAPAADEKL
jgi:hypothetical protein